MTKTSFEDLLSDAKMHDAKIWVFIKRIELEEVLEITKWLRQFPPNRYYTNAITQMLEHYIARDTPIIEFEMKVIFFERELALQFGMLFPFWFSKTLNPSDESMVIDLLDRLTDTSYIKG